MSGDRPGGARAVARCDALGAAPFSDMEGGLFRAWLSPALGHAHDQVGLWMVEAGMRISLDGAANLIGRYDGLEPEAPALLIGSHLDSVRDGGRYDGPLGVMLGIEVVAALHAQGRRLPFAIEVIGFGDEEGSRFPAAMVTSRAVAGTLDPATLDMRDPEGVSIAEALRAFVPEARLSLDGVRHAARSPERTLAYLEAHIEQGPVLEAEGRAVGAVTGIAAQLRYQVRVSGQAGHAGTTSMGLRRDALAGAAGMVVAAEAVARADGSDLVATVGRLEALPGAANVIPGEVRFTLDVRAGDQSRRDRAAQEILRRLRAIATARGLELAVEPIHDLPASPCDPALTDMLEAAMVAAGQPPRRLVSGAGHDAMVMAALCPTAMLFVRCRGGISHNPAEHVETADAEIALEVMLGFLDRLEAAHGA